MKRKIKKRIAGKEFLPSMVIKFYDSIPLPYHKDSEIQTYFSENKSFPWQKLIEEFPGIRIGKLFNSLMPEEIIKMVETIKESRPGYNPPNFLTCVSIDYPSKIYGPELLSNVMKSEIVEYAYVESDAIPPGNIGGANPKLGDQGYLNRASQGINAKYAWNMDGGRGEGNVQFIDIEQGWALDHSDLPSNIPVLYGVNSDFLWHGTAVLGILFMQDNSQGGVGIVHKASPQLISQIVEKTDSNGQTRKANIINDAILKAIQQLDFGDILLLEAQYEDDNLKIWPVETRRMTFDLISLATAKGIIVIEPAGNGGSNLDDFKNARGKKILDRTPGNGDFKDSGAIMVAAASHVHRHPKTASSNFGNRIDCFAWGSNVFTTDDPAEASNPSQPYKTDFDGTSSASAIIAGAALAVQSVVVASGKPRLGPAQMRDILSNNGTSTNKIGVMPDLKKIIDEVLPTL